MNFLEGQQPYIIAEIGSNHNGDMNLARKLIKTAKKVGADSVKFQSWDTTLFSKSVYEDNYFLSDDYRNRSDHTLKSIVKKFAVSEEDLFELSIFCKDQGIDFSSTPFDINQVDPLVKIGAPYIKIASMDINNDRLLAKAASTKLPVLLSTGMATLGEIDTAVATLEKENVVQIVLLHCTALYPTPPNEINLFAMDTLRQFGYPVGFSDHSLGPEIALAAIARGAIVVEKHFTIDKTMFGWDHHMSMDPKEMKILCTGAKRIHHALGNARRIVGQKEFHQRAAFRRSIVSSRDLKSGEILTVDCVVYRRPGTGLDPSLLDHILGMRLIRDLPYDSMIKITDLASGD
jgi:N-acetylneuraminate synthase